MRTECSVIAVVPDLQFSNHGSFVSCMPVSEAGEEWLDAHFESDRPVLIEHRYLEEIVVGARDAGLICHG